MGLAQHLSHREFPCNIAKTLGFRATGRAFQTAAVPQLQSAKPLTPSRVTALAKRYEQGETVKQLAAAFGVHRHTVAAHLERRGIARRSAQRGLDDRQRLDIAKLYESGLSLAQIGERYRVHAKTIANELRKLNVEIRPQGKNYRQARGNAP